MPIQNRFPGAIVHEGYSQYAGYPYAGNTRRINPTILAVIHTTETAGVPYPSSGKSWTFSVERNGTVHQFLDPIAQAPWTNGDAQSRDMRNPVIAAMNLSRYNANEYCMLTIENVNRIFSGERLTAAQIAADAAIVRWAHGLRPVLPIDRTRVIGHYQINGVSRINCPTVPADRARVFDGIIRGVSIPDASMEEIMLFKNPIVTEEWKTVAGPDSTFVRPDGSTGHFVTAERVKSVVEGTYQGKDARLLDYGASHEALIILRTGLVPIPGTRIEGSPVAKTVEVIKEVPTGFTQADIDAAHDAGIQVGGAKEKSRLRKFLGL